MAPAIPTSKAEYIQALQALPETPENIPAFFFSHGSPMLTVDDPTKYTGSQGPLATFLKEFGPTLLAKYKPRGILVFSAHWETYGERLVTDYGDENPLLMDYFGFPRSMYELKFKSRGDKALSERVVQLFKEAGYLARTTPKIEPRGEDGRGFAGPGLDHGVFIPFRFMFGNETDIPIVEASIDGTLSPEGNWKVGQAIAALRKEGILVLSGGLAVHNLRDFTCFTPDTARPIHKDFHQAIIDAAAVPTEAERKEALVKLTKHPGFRACHPREEHFVPIYVAAGAGEGGEVRILAGNYGVPTFAFGI